MATLQSCSAAHFFSLLGASHKLSPTFTMSVQLICPPEISSEVNTAIYYWGMNFPALPHHRNMAASPVGSTQRFYFPPQAFFFSQIYTLFLIYWTQHLGRVHVHLKVVMMNGKKMLVGFRLPIKSELNNLTIFTIQYGLFKRRLK